MRGSRLKDHKQFETEENDLLEFLSLGADLKSVEAEKRFGEYETWKIGIDPGMISIVMALSAVGACPITSCVGGEGHLESHPVMCLQRPHQVCNAARRPQRVLMPEAEKYATQQYILYTTSHQHGLHKRLAVTRAPLMTTPCRYNSLCW